MDAANWQFQLQHAIRHPSALLEHVGLQAKDIGYDPRSISQFPVLVPFAFANRIRPKDPDDPLLRQVFPYPKEATSPPGYTLDPLEETNAEITAGVLQKYQGRILLITTGACAIHCRYCFRRHYPYQEKSINVNQFDAILKRIAADTSLREVILSGGDPLLLSDDKLIRICESLAAIPHVRRVRIHTRLPVVLPDRITTTLVRRLTAIDARLVIVLHINHSNEIDQGVIQTANAFFESGITLLNQSVLLHRINDTSDCLIQLSETLFNHHILPYYLHLLDPVKGTAHYEVPLEKAESLIREIRKTLSGYLVPQLVREQAGAEYKLPVI